MSEDDITELAEQFDLSTDDTDDIEPELVDVLRYIRDQTGLLGDYNQGRVNLAEGGRIIQWYGRDRYLSNHNKLLHWVQCEAEGVHLGVVGVRPHPKTADSCPYAEIHVSSNWGYDDE